jgi:hypothetical protein
MTTKEKYEMIDKSKVPSKTLEILEKMQKASTNFTNAEVNAKIDSALDRLIEGFKANNPSALITSTQAKENVKKERVKAEKKNEGKDLSDKKDTDDKTGLPKKDTIEERKDIIKKDSETDKEARERAKKELEKENEKAKDVIESQIEKLNRIILEDPSLQGFNTGTAATGGGKSTPIIDAERKALPRGARVSKKGWKNQYGASDGGRRYWENRENRSDRKSPEYETGKPYLADGGVIEPQKPIDKMNKLELMYFVSKIAPMKNFYPQSTEGGRVQAKKLYDEYLNRKKGTMNRGGYMAKGGITKDSIKRTLTSDTSQYFLEKDGDGYILTITPRGAMNSNFHYKFHVESLPNDNTRLKYRLSPLGYAKGGYMAKYEKAKADEYPYLTAEDFQRISDKIDKKFLEQDRKSGVHEKFTKYWYNGGREKAIAKYGDDEKIAWEEFYKDFKDDFYGGKMADGGNIYSSDDMYEVKMVSDGVELDSKLIRAKNKKEAREIFEDIYQEKYENEFGSFDLKIEVAESKMADGGDVSDRLQKMREAYETLEMLVKSKIAMAIGIDEAVRIMEDDYAIHPFQLITGAVLGGLLEIDEINKDLVYSALMEAENVTEQYRDSGEGIGSSDITYFTKSVLDDAGYKTAFIDNTLKRVDANGNELVIDKYKMNF